MTSDAWLAAVYRDCAPALARYFLRRGVPPEEAADLVADVFVVALTRRRELPPDDELRPWLFGVAAKLRLERSRAGSGPAAPAAAAAQSPRDPRDERVLGVADQVAAALATLTDVDRELTLLTVWDGLTTAEAARALGLTPGAGRVRLHRARSRLAGDPALRALLPAAQGEDPTRATCTPDLAAADGSG